MFTKILVSFVVASLVSAAFGVAGTTDGSTVATRGYSADHIKEIGETDGAARLMSATGRIPFGEPTVIRAHETVIAVAGRVTIDPPRVTVCRTRELIQGSGAVTECGPVDMF